MSAASYEALAERLRRAYAAGPVPPLRDGLAPSDGEGAYAVQALNTRYWVSRGRKIVGRKIGLTAKAVQAQLGVDQPDFGVLFDDMLIRSGGMLSPAKAIQPKVEAEVALVLAHDLDKADATAADVANAVLHVLPAIEIVDSRIADWKISFADTVADTARPPSSCWVISQGCSPAWICDLRHGAGDQWRGGFIGRGRCLPGPPPERGRLAGAHAEPAG